jgi:hypothetical protein
MSINVGLMEKGELQRMCVKLFNQFEEFKNCSIVHLQRLKNFEIEKDTLIGKIKSLEDALMKSKLPLKNHLSIDSAAYSSHVMPVTTRFLQKSVSNYIWIITCR